MTTALNKSQKLWQAFAQVGLDHCQHGLHQDYFTELLSMVQEAHGYSGKDQRHDYRIDHFGTRLELFDSANKPS